MQPIKRWRGQAQGRNRISVCDTVAPAPIVDPPAALVNAVAR